jgi:uncharacterized protein (TIGR03435 family)
MKLNSLGSTLSILLYCSLLSLGIAFSQEAGQEAAQLSAAPQEYKLTTLESARKMQAQSQAAAPLRFIAVSVKLAADQNIISTRPTRSVRRFRWNTGVVFMISYAYHLELWRISQAPGLTSLDDIYDVEATNPPHATEDQVRLMLQSLLNDRFHLVVHHTAKNAVSGYALSVAKDGARLQEAKPSEPSDNSGQLDEGWVAGTLPTADVMLITAHNANMLQLSADLQKHLGTTVLDQTGLTGRYNFELKCPGAASSDEFPGLLASCVKQAGLRLEKYKGVVDFLVIDKIGPFVEN